jgi:hypothetical protein
LDAASSSLLLLTVPRVRPQASLALALLLASALPSLHARTWTDTQGRALEADFVSATATEVTVRRAADARTFTLPLTTLSAADRDFISAQLAAAAPAAADFTALNTALDLPLLADDTLWDDEPAAVAKRLQLPREGKTDRFEGYRAYPRPARTLLGSSAHMLSLQAAEGRITSLVVQFTNRGDFPAFLNRDRVFSPPKADLKAFDDALQRDFDILTAALTAKLGEPKREIAVGGLDAGRRSLRWESGPHALLLSHDAEQMVSLKIIPAEKSATARLADAEVRRLFKERITRRPNGDVILDQIPMVNQGPKGYCVPATFERYLRYAGIPADMYELAAVGGTDFGGGTSFQSMARSLDRFVRRQGRRLEQVSPKLTAQGVARYLDEGRPLIWGLYSTEAYNALADANTKARRAATDAAPWKPALTPAELGAFGPEPETAHACLIVGYNRATNELAVSDSWGPRFQERWIPFPAAQKISQDEFWVLAW